MVKFKLATSVRTTFQNTLLLDPYAQKTLLKSDASLVKSVTGIDCSWEVAGKMFTKKFAGLARKLPPLLAGNPVNYSKLNKLTTVEAIAGAVFIMGYESLAKDLLDKFKWGHTFYDLNRDLLQDYSKANSLQEIDSIIKEYQLMA